MFSPLFSFHFGEKSFVSLGEKYLGPTQKFSFPSSQPNNTQIHFLSYFLFKVFHPPYFTSKRTHPKGLFGKFHSLYFAEIENFFTESTINKSKS